MKGCSRIPRYLSCFSLFSSSSSSSVLLAYGSVYFSVARYRTTTTATTTVIPNTHPSPQKIDISTASCASASYSLLSRSIFAFQRLESNGAPTHSRAYHASMTTTLSRMTAHTDAKRVTKGEEPSNAKRTLAQKKRFPLLHMVAVVATRWFYQLLHPHPCPLSAPSWIVDTYDFSHGRIPHGSFMELLSTMYAQQQQQQRKKLAEYQQEEVVEKNGDKAIAAAAGVEKKTNHASDEKGEREIDTLSPLFFFPFSGSRKMFEEQVAHTPGRVVVLLYARGWGIAIHEEARKKKENRVGRKCTPHSSPGWWGRRKEKKHVVHASSTVSPSPPPSSSSGGGSPSLTSTGKESNRAGKTTTTLSRHAQTNAVSSEEAHSGMASSNTMAHEGEDREKKETYQEDKEEDENAVLWESIAIPTAERTEQQKRNRVALETIFSLHSSSSSTAVPSHDSEKESSACGTTTSSTEHLRTERKKNEEEEEEKISNEGVKDAKNAGKKPKSVTLPSSSPGVLLPPFQCWTMNVYASADHMELACLYDFRATPMWLGFRDGVLIESVEGGHPTRLLSFVETLLLHHSNKPLPES